MPYRVSITPQADRAVGRLPRDIRARIASRLDALAENPRPPGCLKLTNRLEYRIRIGDYRVIYTIHDDELVVLVVEVGHRRDVYG